MELVQEFSSSQGKEVKWHGNHDENCKRLLLKAGQLSMFYESGNLRYISIGNIEIVRMIYSALRDKEWLTIKPVISEEEFEVGPDSFRICYKALYRSGEIDFPARINRRLIMKWTRMYLLGYIILIVGHGEVSLTL